MESEGTEVAGTGDGRERKTAENKSCWRSTRKKKKTMRIINKGANVVWLFHPDYLKLFSSVTHI